MAFTETSYDVECVNASGKANVITVRVVKPHTADAYHEVIIAGGKSVRFSAEQWGHFRLAVNKTGRMAAPAAVVQP